MFILQWVKFTEKTTQLTMLTPKFHIDLRHMPELEGSCQA